jgi:hypothetical protein
MPCDIARMQMAAILVDVSDSHVRPDGIQTAT